MQELEDRIFDLLKNKKEKDYNKLIDNVLKLILRPEIYYTSLNPEDKRDMVSSIYPEKIIFDGIEHRTQRLNEIIAHIYHINSELREKKEVEREKIPSTLKVTPRRL